MTEGNNAFQKLGYHTPNSRGELMPHNSGWMGGASLYKGGRSCAGRKEITGDTAPHLWFTGSRLYERTKNTLPRIPMIVWLYSLYTYVTYTVYLCVCKMCIYTHVCKRYIQIYLLYSFLMLSRTFNLNSGIVTWRTPLAIILTHIVLLEQK